MSATLWNWMWVNLTPARMAMTAATPTHHHKNGNVFALRQFVGAAAAAAALRLASAANAGIKALSTGH